MKISFVIISSTFAQAIEEEFCFKTPQCHWLGGTSGQNVECLPDYYIDGTCGSGIRDDCKFDDFSYSFGIHCCKANSEIKVGPKKNCHWYGGASGDNVECPPDLNTFAVGRCSTSQFSSYGGEGVRGQTNLKFISCRIARKMYRPLKKVTTNNSFIRPIINFCHVMLLFMF
jgi:hypothetical protein